jgi:NTP pyrophosphatase (non-canonical NTP hydrolase)
MLGAVMNLSRYDHLLDQVNAASTEQRRKQKCQEELLELGLALHHSIEGRDNSAQIAEETADILLTVRGIIRLMDPDFEHAVNQCLEAKAQRLHLRMIRGELV